jgi:hypothetical protein
MSATTVFISYSHDTPEHSQRVLQLANALWDQGVEVELDEFQVRPPHGWPHWCEEQLRPGKAAFVLVICTETYRQRVEVRTPADEGRGVFWEGSIINSYLYDDKSNKRFIPVLLPGATEDDIPRPLRVYTRYQLKAFDLNDAGYLALYRELTSQPGVMKPDKRRDCYTSTSRAVRGERLQPAAPSPSPDHLHQGRYLPHHQILP